MRAASWRSRVRAASTPANLPTDVIMPISGRTSSLARLRCQCAPARARRLPQRFVRGSPAGCVGAWGQPVAGGGLSRVLADGNRLCLSRFATESVSGDVKEGAGSRRPGRRKRRNRGALGSNTKESATEAEDSPSSGDEILLFAANRAKLLRPLGLASFVQAGGWLLMLVNGPSLPG